MKSSLERTRALNLWPKHLICVFADVQYLRTQISSILKFLPDVSSPPLKLLQLLKLLLSQVLLMDIPVDFRCFNGDKRINALIFRDLSTLLGLQYSDT